MATNSSYDQYAGMLDDEGGYESTNEAPVGGGSAFPSAQAEDDPKSDDGGGVLFFEDFKVSDFDGFSVINPRKARLKRQDGSILDGVFVDGLFGLVLDGARRRVQTWRKEEGDDGKISSRSTTSIYVAILPVKGSRSDPKIIRIVGRGQARAAGFDAAMKPIRAIQKGSHITPVFIAADRTVKSTGDQPREIRTITCTLIGRKAPAAAAEWSDLRGMPAAQEDADSIMAAAKAREAREAEGGAHQGGARQGGARQGGGGELPPPRGDDEIPF